jgi:hypothetical protein
MKPQEIEQILVQLQGDLLLQNKKIADLQEEIRLLRVQLERKMIVSTPRDYHPPVDISRASEVYKQSKVKNNG